MNAVASVPPAALIGQRTRKRIRPFRLHRPEDLQRALSTWRSCRDGAAFLAGGVDLINEMKEGTVFPDVIDLGRVGSFGEIAVRSGHVSIGATVTHDALAAADLPGPLAAFARDWVRIGNPRIRHKGTLGGNLMAGNPGYDLAPCLVALGATVAGWHRHGPELTTDVPGRPSRRDFLLSEIRLPLDLAAFTYDRSERPALSVAIAVRGSHDAVTSVRFGLALYGRIAEVELPLDGTSSLPGIRARAPDLAAEAAYRLPEPFEPGPVSPRQRRHLAAVAMKRALAQI